MKKLFVIALTLMLTACVSSRYPFIQTSGYFDYSYLFEKGFFVTESNSVSFNYTPVGSVYASESSGYLKKEKAPKRMTSKAINKKQDQLYPENDPFPKYGDYREATVKSVLDEIYKQAIALGANGVINLKISFSDPVVTKTEIKGSGITITGMAIKK